MRQNINATAIVILVTCCAIWGFQPIALKWASADMSPIMQLALRSIGSTLCLWAFLAWRGLPLIPHRKIWGVGLFVGVLFVMEFCFIGWGIRTTLASHLTVCLYTAPIFVAIGLHFHSQAERLSWKQWMGVLIAFSGIVVAFIFPEWRQPTSLVSLDGNISPVLLGNLWGIMAGLFWALTTLAIRYTILADTEPEYTLLMQLIVGAVGLSLIAWGQRDAITLTVHWSGRLIGLLLFQMVIVSFASYLAWFWLLRHYVAGRISVFSFMTPIFGIAFGVIFLDEPLTTEVIIGTTLVLTGIGLVSFVKKHGY